MLKPETCKISRGTTLAEISEYLKMNSELLKRYHNIYCPLEDLIEMDIPKHVTVLYIPPEEYRTGESGVFQSDRNIIRYSSPNTLYNRAIFTKKYGISQKVFENEKQTTELSYEMNIEKRGSTRFMINRKNFYVNKKRSDFTIEQIAEQMGNIFYPLELETYETGLLKHITNYDEIITRWKQKKQQLTGYYKGKLAEDMMSRFEAQLAYKGKTQQKITGSLFYNLYFLPLYDTFSADKTYYKTIGYNISGKEKTLYDIVFTLNSELSALKKIHIEITGKHIEKETLKESGSIDFTCKLNTKDNSIYSITGEISLETIPEKTKTIRFELYELTT